MFVMLRTFLLIQKEIWKAIIDCCRHDLFLTENEIRQAQSLTDVLEIVELCSTTLGSNQNDLLKAIKFWNFFWPTQYFINDFMMAWDSEKY